MLATIVVASLLQLTPTSAFTSSRRSQLSSSSSSSPLPSSINCTWIYHTQPLDHFSPGSTSEGASTYDERVCVYSQYVSKDAKNPPILFYVGNESPVEEYVNNTGLMWTLGKKLGAHLVFAEHRYFGGSIPQLKGVPNCLAYCTSAQALADYALLVHHLKQNILHAPNSAVVAFGGSYGGMLAAWARMKYPSSFQGAIAGSAPIWGFPSDHVQLDGSMIPVTRAASTAGGATDTCKNNILAAWPIMRQLGKTQEGRAMLVDAFDLCPTSTGSSPLPTPGSVEELIQYGHQPWFELAEGDYPFPSEYITFAVASTPSPLPAWPVRVACTHVGVDVGIELQGNVSDVHFDVVVDGGDQIIHVDWNATTMTTKGQGNQAQQQQQQQQMSSTLANSPSVQKLMRGLSNSIAVWYNVSGSKQCYQLDSNVDASSDASSDASDATKTISKTTNTTSFVVDRAGHANNNVCTADTIPGGNAAGWGVICCNENLNLVNTLVSGVGNDMFWPPSVYPRNWNRTQQIIDASAPCYESYAQQGLYGVPRTSDPFSTWENVYYGGLDGPSQASNIVFSNGLLDPWTAAGVTTNISSSVVSVLLKLGGHHLDLFFPTNEDPPCAIEARQIETEHVKKWIAEHNAKHHH